MLIAALDRVDVCSIVSRLKVKCCRRKDFSSYRPRQVHYARQRGEVQLEQRKSRKMHHKKRTRGTEQKMRGGNTGSSVNRPKRISFMTEGQDL